jgi:hypothetical protein
MTKQAAGDIAAAVAGLARVLIDMIEAGNSPPGDEGEIRELAEFARLLRPLSTATRLRAEGGARKPLPVCRFLAEALGGAGGASAPLVPPLEELLASLVWTQNPNYRRAPPADGFLDNYGYAVIAGPEAGAPALVRHPSLALGLLLLGPKTTYPAHRHPASELYVPLGPAEWMAADAPFAARRPGFVIHHRPNIVHATRTPGAPLAALYLWAGDLATHAQLVSDAAEPMAGGGPTV